MVKITTSIKIEKEHLSSIKELGINLSEFVREKIEEELLSPPELQKRIEKYQNLLKRLKNTKKGIYSVYTNILPSTLEEKNFLQETKVLLKEKPEFLEGRINLYINNFAKIKKPTRKQFMEILDKIPITE